MNLMRLTTLQVRLSLLVWLLMCLGALSAQAMTADRHPVGVVTEVTDAKFMMPQGVDKPLKPGTSIYLNDRIHTGATGRVKMKFEDGTVFTLGSNADLVIDDFVYTPKRKGSRFGVQILSGAFTFLSGQIASLDAENFNVRTPLATIGIRGTHGLAIVEEDLTGCIVLLPDPRPGKEDSAMIVTSGGHSVVLEQPGWGTDVKGMGMPPTPPKLWPADRVAEMRKRAGA